MVYMILEKTDSIHNLEKNFLNLITSNVCLLMMSGASIVEFVKDRDMLFL